MTIFVDFYAWIRAGRKLDGRPIPFGAFRFVCELRRIVP